MRASAAALVVLGGCTPAKAPPATVSAAPSTPVTPAPSPVPAQLSTVAAPDPPREALHAPVGLALAGVYVEPGHRQPLSVRGEIVAVNPPRGDEGTAAWTVIELGGPEGRHQIRLLLRPRDVPLPFAEGDYVSADIDCRKGGWTRVCDGVFRARNRRLLLAVAGSGDPSLVDDWSVERGPVALSEERAKGPKSIRYTFSLLVKHARQRLNVPPHEWQLLRANDGAFLVEGHAVSWEGVRPADAPDFVHYAIVRLAQGD